MKELPKKMPRDVSGGVVSGPGGTCVDPPYIPGKTPVIEEPFPGTLPGPVDPNPNPIV